MVCFNSEASIAASIQSFLDQDWPDTELVVMDGASRDRTCEIVRSFDSDRIRLTSEPDEGIYDAINKGIQRATGEVIGLLHSNDQLAAPDILTRIGRAFQDPALDAVYADVAFFHADQPGKIVRRYRSSRFRPDRLAWGWMPAHTSLYLRRRVFERFGYYKTDYHIGGDFEFVARIFHETDLAARYFPEIWVHMEHGGASTAGLKAKITLNREVLRACKSNGISTNYAKILSKYPMKVLELFSGTGR